MRPAAIVTGASSGIGEATAIELARRGYAVALAARRAERLEQVADACRQAGGEPLTVPTDVADETQVNDLVGRAVGKFGRLDVMVNNAGIGLFALLAETTAEDMRRIMDVNFYGVFYGCRAAIPVMISQRRGHIFNVSSVIGKRGTPFHAAYCASKFAIMGMDDALRVELKPYKVRVTSVCPATTATEFFDHSESGRQASAAFRTWQRPMSPQRVARGIVRAIGKDRPELVFSLGGRFLALMSALWPKGVDRGMMLYYRQLARARAAGGEG